MCKCVLILDNCACDDLSRLVVLLQGEINEILNCYATHATYYEDAEKLEHLYIDMIRLKKNIIIVFMDAMIKTCKNMPMHGLFMTTYKKNVERLVYKTIDFKELNKKINNINSLLRYYKTNTTKKFIMNKNSKNKYFIKRYVPDITIKKDVIINFE